MIVLWGITSDDPIRRVREELARRGADVMVLDQRRMLATEIVFDVARRPAGELRVGDERVDLAAVTAVYARPYPWHDSPELAPFSHGSEEWRHAGRLFAAISCWLELTPARVVNPLSAASFSGSKPRQLRRIREAGFATPATLVTTDPEAAHAFCAKYPEPIYKSVSGVRSVASRMTEQRRARIADVQHCPTQFQEYIPGQDFRVHTFGKRAVCTKVVSKAVDYRYASRTDDDVAMEAFELPRDVAQKCLELSAALELPLAGIDLRKTPGGDWYCFEVNSSPGFTYFEHYSGQPLAGHAAELLHESE